MLQKLLFLIVIFYLLAVLQTSFLVHFNFSGIILNLVLMAVIFINIFAFSRPEKIFSAIFGGFCLDVFSLNNAGGFFGFYTLVLVGLSLLLKVILDKYVRISFV